MRAVRGAAHSNGTVGPQQGGGGRGRRRRLALASVAALAVLAGGGTVAALAQDQPKVLLSDDFSAGLGKWSTSGGKWWVNSSAQLRQGNGTSDTARATAGSSQWVDYAVQARVKSTAYTADDGMAGISARVTGNSTFARLVLVAAGRAEVQVVRNGKAAVVAAGTAGVTSGTWHTLRLEVRGRDLRGFVDGTQVPAGPGSTATMSGSGKVGLQTRKATATFDNVTVTQLSGTAPSTPVTTSPTPKGNPKSKSTAPAAAKPTVPFAPNPGPNSGWNPPANLSAALDKVWAHQEATYNNGNVYAFKNYLWDQIMATKGNINYCVRWESSASVTAAQRDQVQAQLQRQFQKWMDAMTEKGQGWNGWPYPKVNVKVVGWAVTDRNLLQWNDNSVDVYVGDINESAPQCAPPCGRFFHQDNDYGGCPGGASHHYDMSLWLTDGFGGGTGGDWGQRIGREYYMDGLNADNVHILVHELGHSYGLDDFYDWDPGVGGFIMMAGSASQVTEFDKWMLRDWWRHMKTNRGWAS